MGQLQANNFEVHHQSTDTDSAIVIVNTCGFIDRAKEESINTILSMANAKKKGKIDKLYVTGCLSERYKNDLEAEIPEVDAFFGTLELPSLLKKLNADYKHELIGERLLTTPDHYAYLKIAEGCNRTCSFCAIPLMRGGHVSRSIEDLVTEAKFLARNGVKEIMLIAQELTYYGLDLYKKRALSNLLNELCKVDGIEWIRLHYAYPSKFPMDIIETMRNQPKICNYLDMPLQHANDKVLMDMKRQITQNTMLVGFPNESEADFADLCNFIDKVKFNRLGVFQYSHEENTSAHGFDDNITPEIKAERASILMDKQHDIALELNQHKIGKTLKVLFDRKEGDFFVGRTEGDSPEVDNEVLVDAKTNFVRLGDFANIHITDAEAFDLFGDVVL
jgi:ribosomal protein S12 methylthiotransferase